MMIKMMKCFYEMLLALFSAGIIVRDSYHPKYLTRRKQDLLNDQSSVFVEWSYAVLITTTPRCYYITTIL